MDYIGGGFGSKFGPDAWAVVGANLSKAAGGRPVKLFLDRATEQMIAGNRPSAYGKIKIAGSKDGTITAWQSDSWGTGGFATVGGPPLPYIFDSIPNKRLNHTSISVNAGPQRAWRAPNNQQAAYLTWTRGGRLGRQGRSRSPGRFHQERSVRSQGARRNLPLPAPEGRRAGRMEEAVAAPRPERQRPHQARPRHRHECLGRRRPSSRNAAPSSTPTAPSPSRSAPRISAPAPAPSSPRWPPKPSACP